MNTAWELAARGMQDVGGPVLEYPVSHENEYGFYAKANWEVVYVCLCVFFFSILSTEVSVFITDVNEKLLCQR